MIRDLRTDNRRILAIPTIARRGMVHEPQRCRDDLSGEGA